MNQQERIHDEAHRGLRSALSGLGLELNDHIPWCWQDCKDARRSATSPAIIRWTSAVELVDQLFSRGELPDGRALLQQLVGSSNVVDVIESNVERRLLEGVYDLPPHRRAFAGSPNIRFRVNFGGVPGLADARRKNPDGMLRRYALKPAESAQLDALAAWIVVEGEGHGEQAKIPAAVIGHLEALGYEPVLNLKTAATSKSYKAVTFQRIEEIDGVKLGGEVKVFTVEQFREAEVDPCSDSARPRYERRRMLELAFQLGFPTTTVHFVRHGLTTANVNHVLHGWRSSRLEGTAENSATTKGLLFSAGYNGGRPAAIFSSDLARAARTCELFTQPFRAEARQLPGLRERHLGEFEGKPRPPGEEGHAFFARYGADLPIPGGESFKAMASRVIVAAQMAVEPYTGSEVMVFTHAGPLRALLGGIDGVPAAIQWDLKSPSHLEVATRYIPRGFLTRVLDQLFMSIERRAHMSEYSRQDPAKGASAVHIEA